MFYALRIRSLVYFCCACMLTSTGCTAQKNETIIERTNTMNEQVYQQSGQFLAKDNHGIPLVLEWYKTNIISPDFATSMKDAWTLACGAYTPVEMQFLKAFPAVVGKEAYFRPFEPLFEKGPENVDWKAAQETMQSILKGHFVFDPAQFPEQVIKMFANDSCYFVSLKDPATNKQLGFITFLMRENYTAGDGKVMSFAVQTTHQKRGLGKLLMSSIFEIVPEIKRIFLCTRVTNDTALKAYGSWGFTRDEKPILDHAFNLEHWSFLEYKIERSESLQKIARMLKH